MTRLRFLAALFAALVACAARGAECPPLDDITIRIVKPGGNAEYWGPDATEQAPVEVLIGDRVIWKNEGTATHTATSVIELDDGSPLFDTDDVSAGDDSTPLEITRAMFDAAGGKPGGKATLCYFCGRHSVMQSALIVSEAAEPVGPLSLAAGAATATRAATLVRRDIEVVQRDPAALQRYRDAWRRLQQSGTFANLAGYHGCPRWHCHRNSQIFLAWHREYVLRLEQALGEPLHYWDWASPSSIANGIPAAFRETSYRSADGNVYDNPLRFSRFACPPGSRVRATGRGGMGNGVRPLAELRTYRAAVRFALGRPDYGAFNSAINSPHGSIHTWVAEDMGAFDFAAYDPVFWAHHSNVDRLWASWQNGGGPAPVPDVADEELPGFEPRKVAHVVDYAALGYGYDRYGLLPLARIRGAVDLRTAAAADRDQEPEGLGKTFQIAPAAMRMAAGDQPAPLDLFVKGLPDHPPESGMVLVFVNQPDASVEDADESNPNFAGSFGIFGGGTGESAGDAHEAQAGVDESRWMMRLFGDRDPPLASDVSTVTLLIVDASGAVVAREDVPISDVEIRAGDDPAEDAEAPRMGAAASNAPPGAAEFTGISTNESWDEAWQDAVNQAQAALTEGAGADRMIGVEFLSADGERGGIAGVRTLRICIRAWLK